MTWSTTRALAVSALFSVVVLAGCGRTAGVQTLDLSGMKRGADPLAAAAKATPVAEGQANHSFDGATAAAPASLISGRIGGSAKGDDYFKVAVPAGQDGMLKLTLVEYKVDWAPKLTVFNHAQVKRGEAKAAEGAATPLVFEQRATAGETYYVALTDDVPGGARADYKLLVEFTPVEDANEPNNSFDTAKALNPGTSTPVVLFSGSESEDVDYFSVALGAGQSKLNVNFANNGEITPVVRLYDASKKLIEYQTGNLGGNVNFTAEGLAAGTYYVKLQAGAGEGTRNGQLLTVSAQ